MRNPKDRTGSTASRVATNAAAAEHDQSVEQQAAERALADEQAKLDKGGRGSARSSGEGFGTLGDLFGDKLRSLSQ